MCTGSIATCAHISPRRDPELPPSLELRLLVEGAERRVEDVIELGLGLLEVVQELLLSLAQGEARKASVAAEAPGNPGLILVFRV